MEAGTLKKESLAKAEAFLGSLLKWATGPCGDSFLSGAGSAMTLTQTGFGTDTFVHSTREGECAVGILAAVRKPSEF